MPHSRRSSVSHLWASSPRLRPKLFPKTNRDVPSILHSYSLVQVHINLVPTLLLCVASFDPSMEQVTTNASTTDCGTVLPSVDGD